ncbi:RNA-directed DNA polymerase [Bacillus sp. 3103sda1]|uniref:RNA-directed DNA polymerase n=1 Tax=Bacillus sp. 3103sda1 TaxID=2953808 RepID=UPI00209FFCE0|nr:RNA-directed DNA polymerase [Bacillus sp. 3103sda1]MCP1122880.1 RNA-directed DNA polymerase [Bacillus sp. 3103sda1]
MKISQYKKVTVGSRTFYIGSIHQKKIDNDVHKLIKSRYQKVNKNRNYIIDSLINQITFNFKLPEKYCYTVIKIDIKNFFESINTHKLYKRIVRSNILNEVAMEKIKQVVFSKKVKGLPQGVSFSSLLAEVYLEDFDYNLKIAFDELLFYSRYVDDILLIFNGDHLNQVENIVDRIEHLLKPLNLTLNRDKKLEKCLIGAGNTFEFSYLGYEFSNQMNPKLLTISVAENKIKKYKVHIEDIFNKFHFSNRNDSDFYKLYYSLRNLLWVTITKDFIKDKDLIYGFSYNYKRINSFEAKAEFNAKLKYHIHRNNYFTRKQKTQLYSLFFKESIDYKFNYNKISRKRMLLMMNQLNITPKYVPGKNPKNIWIGQIFKELYA